MANTKLPPIAKKSVFLTGLPSCGKTTVMEKLAHLLAGRSLAGFLTLEIREHGQRVGFEAVGVTRFIHAAKSLSAGVGTFR